MQRHDLLVIDDDEGVLYSIKKSLESDSLRVLQARCGVTGLELARTMRPDVILLDLRLREASGLDVLRELRALDDTVPVVMFTAFSTTTAAIEATKAGAFDYLLKPVDLTTLTRTVDKALACRASAGEAAEADVPPTFLPGVEVNIVGSSPAMQQIYKQIGRFAPTSGNVLILGESGTGKELVARAIHHHSLRRSGPFLAINCAALSETLLESELFGHERGAFTGADRRRIGKFEYASGGTLFLDEVADMSSATQAKVLRLLQEQRFERLGGNDTITTDARIVAATNKDLAAMVRQGVFREDLYYRLDVFSMRLPPLRDRREDLPELVSYFIGSFKDEFGKGRAQLEPAVMEALARYDWPGNMRELQSVVKHALAHSIGGVVRLDDLPPAVVAQVTRGGGGGARAGAQANDLEDALTAMAQRLMEQGDTDVYGRALAIMEQVLLPAVLSRTQGNLQQACEILGMSRNTLKAKMRQHRITIGRSVLSNSDSLLQSLRARITSGDV